GRPTRAMVEEIEQRLDDFHAAVRGMKPGALIDELTVQVAVLDALRRRADDTLQWHLCVLLSRYAESLSWMQEEAGDLPRAVYWADRASHWARRVEWTPMVAYALVRRSMMALSFADDGLQAIENGQQAVRMPGVPPYIQGLAAKQIAFGHALLGCADD